MANQQEANLKKKADGGKCNHRRSRPYYFRRCKYKGLSSITSIESLPDEMLFHILLELEPQEIYESAMLVCRRWYKIIRTDNFIQEHLNHSRPGLVIRDMSTSKHPTFVTVSAHGRVHKLKYPLKFKTGYWATCNGLGLIEYPSKKYEIHRFFIENYTIKKRIALPPFSGDFYDSCIGYAPASKEYKVVRLHPDLKNSKVHGCAILTLGVDNSWRYVDTQHISSEEVAHLLTHKALTTEGFVHWADWKNTCLLSLNVETEIITETQIPEEGQDFIYRIFNTYLSTWRSLTLIIGSPNRFSWDVWEMVMKPNAKSGEWNKVLKIDLRAQKCRFEKHLKCAFRKGLVPVGWLNYMEVLVLCGEDDADKSCVLYNVRTQEIEFLNLGHISGAYLHMNSLVWF